MPKVLLDAHLQSYQNEGFICPVRVLSEGEAGVFRAALAEQEAIMGGRLLRMDNSHLFLRWAYDLALHPKVLDTLEDLLGPDLFVHSTRIFYKHPHDPAYVSWHQDGTYSSLNSKPAPSAWIALSYSGVENGCLRVVSASHQSGKLDHIETFAQNNLLNHGEEVQKEIDESQVRDLVLQPGEMSLHHINLIHGSTPNHSNLERIGFAVSYITPAVRRSHLPVVRARGSSTDHEFELWPGPPQLSMADAIKAHAEFAERHHMRQPRVAG
jgi:ectoine hydroxylase-related dioxygenase (phytanoyl-CoA dioxygenase family)